MNNLVLQLKVIIKQDADRDGSGSMDFQEFVEMMIKVGIEVNFDSFYIRFKKWRCFTFQEVGCFTFIYRESLRRKPSRNSNRLFEFLTRFPLFTSL